MNAVNESMGLDSEIFELADPVGEHVFATFSTLSMLGDETCWLRLASAPAFSESGLPS